MTDRTTELLSVGDILWNKPCDERIVVIAANERNVWLRKVQKNDKLAMCDGHVWAMLGKKCNVKNMCTQSYAQIVFELDGHVEQAIAATLGTSNDIAKALIDDMLDFIGNCCNTTLDYACCDPVDCKYLGGDGELAECTRYQNFLSRAKAIVATLGNSTLTAEQVRKVVEGHGNIMDNRLYEDWQAVADELNARLGGTCELTYGENDDGIDGWYTECGGWFAATCEDKCIVNPIFCQKCGKRAEL